MKRSTLIIILAFMAFLFGIINLEYKAQESRRSLIFSMSQRGDCDAVITYIKDCL